MIIPEVTVWQYLGQYGKEAVFLAAVATVAGLIVYTTSTELPTWAAVWKPLKVGVVVGLAVLGWHLLPGKEAS